MAHRNRWPLMNGWLVGGLEHDFFDFPYIVNVIIPSDELHHIFSEGWYTTSQIRYLRWYLGVCLKMFNTPWFHGCFDGENNDQLDLVVPYFSDNNGIEQSKLEFNLWISLNIYESKKCMSVENDENLLGVEGDPCSDKSILWCNGI